MPDTPHDRHKGKHIQPCLCDKKPGQKNDDRGCEHHQRDQSAFDFLGFDIPKFSFVSLHDFLQLFPIHSRSFHRVWLPVALWFKKYGSQVDDQTVRQNLARKKQRFHRPSVNGQCPPAGRIINGLFHDRLWICHRFFLKQRHFMVFLGSFKKSRVHRSRAHTRSR